MWMFVNVYWITLIINQVCWLTVDTEICEKHEGPTLVNGQFCKTSNELSIQGKLAQVELLLTAFTAEHNIPFSQRNYFRWSKQATLFNVVYNNNVNAKMQHLIIKFIDLMISEG